MKLQGKFQACLNISIEKGKNQDFTLSIYTNRGVWTCFFVGDFDGIERGPNLALARQLPQEVKKKVNMITELVETARLDNL